MNRLWLGLLIWFLGLFTAVQARSYDDIKQSKSIVVAVYRDFAPFSMLVDGQATGIDIDIARYIAKQLKVKLQFQWISADENVEDDLRNNLWKGHYLKRTIADLMLRVPYDRRYSQLRDDIGELVHGQVHMFGPYHSESWQIIYNKKKIDQVDTMAMFQYHNIGVETDSVPDFYLSSAFRGRLRERSHHFPTTADAVVAMTRDEVDAVMGLRSQVSALQHQLSDNYVLASNAFPMLGRQQWDIGMAVKNDYRQLSYAIGDIVEQLVLSGKMAAIFKAHHSTYQLPMYYQAESGN